MGIAPGHHPHPTPPYSGILRAERRTLHEKQETQWGLKGVLAVSPVVPVLRPTLGLLGTELMSCGHWVSGWSRWGRQGGVWGSGGQEFQVLVLVVF